MQHLVVRTAQPDLLIADDWLVNGAGRKGEFAAISMPALFTFCLSVVSHAFGFGLMDAHAMVMKARNWTSVPTQRICIKTVISDGRYPRIVPPNVTYVIPFQVIISSEI